LCSSLSRSHSLSEVRVGRRGGRRGGRRRRGGGGRRGNLSIMVMMDGSLDAERIAGYFKGKSVLVTGATGFLGKSKYKYKSLA
jgi:hypothetical protein